MAEDKNQPVYEVMIGCPNCGHEFEYGVHGELRDSILEEIEQAKQGVAKEI